jgi:hypothetical protein
VISERTLGIRINLANWKTKNLYFLSSFEATVWQWADRRCMFQDFIYRCTMLSCSFSGLLMLTFISSVTSSSREFENLCLFCSREFLSLSGSFLQAPSMNHLNHEAMRLMFGFRQLHILHYVGAFWFFTLIRHQLLRVFSK